MAELTDEQIELWVKMLDDVPQPAALERLRKHVRTNKFPPTIAEIVGKDADSNVDYGRLREDTIERFAEMDAWERQAIPLPPHLRPKLIGSGGGEQ